MIANRSRAAFTVMLTGTLAGCGGQSIAPVETVKPVSTATAKAESPWTAEVIGIPESMKGILSYAVMGDGTAVAALSYPEDGEPFLVYSGKIGQLSKAVAPWACLGSPAELEAVGKDVWVHCADPEGKTEPGRTHFFHSSDGGASWARVGAIDSAVAMGSYAVSSGRDAAGGKLFVSGSFEGKSAALQVVSREKDGHYRATAAAGKLEWPKETVTVVAASPDGTQIAILGEMPSDAGPLIAMAASTDGGQTFRQLWRTTWRYKLAVQTPTILKGELSTVVEDDKGRIVALFAAPVPGESFKTVMLPKPAEDACSYGARIAARFAKDDWRVSVDSGGSFKNVAPPPAAAGDLPPLMSCSERGAHVNGQLLAWPRP